MGVGSLEHPLFRALVVCGAALTSVGCGGKTGAEEPATGGASGSGASGGAPAMSGGGYGAVAQAGASGARGVRCPADCESPAQFVCDDYFAGKNCRCKSDGPRSALDCAVEWDFTCAAAQRPSSCGVELVLGPDLDCSCAAGQLHPEDCEHTEQFQCSSYRPYPVGCHCEPNAPLKEEDCTTPARFGCLFYDPPAACSCSEVLPIR